MIQNFLSLLRLGVITSKASGEVFQKLFLLSMQEWQEVMALAERQGGLAIAVDGLQVLMEAHKGAIIAVKENPAEWQMWLL